MLGTLIGALEARQVKLPGDEPSDAHDDARLHSTLAGGFRSLPDLGRH